MDENEFVRQMTLRICGSLNIEKTLRRSFDYMVRMFPLDRLSLHLYERNIKAVRTIALTTQNESSYRNTLTPLPPEVCAAIEDPRMPTVRIVNRPEDDPVNRQLAVSFDLPGTSVLMMRLIIEETTLGTLALVVKGHDRYSDRHARWLSLLNEAFAIALSNTLKHQEILRLKDALAEENRCLREDLHNLIPDEIVGTHGGLSDVVTLIRNVAPLESPVLLLGETGVGKGVLAQLIHRLSPRSKGPFVTVNSGAIPETLIDSELFGHEKGAFTGAVEMKRGRFERGQGGTVFLDEIGELPARAQLRMLRVLQEKTIERVGGSRAIPVNIRIIAATHRNLKDMTASGRFREDLWFRINVFPIGIPPLRERKSDIPALVDHFIFRKTRELKLSDRPRLSRGAMDRLMDYGWPGNVRELENVVEREMILNRESPLSFSFLLGEGNPTAPEEPQAVTANFAALEEVTACHIRRALDLAGGVVHGPGGAAALLKTHPSTLRSRMKKLRIPYGRKALL